MNSLKRTDLPGSRATADELMERVRSDLAQRRELALESDSADTPAPMPAIFADEIMSRVRAEVARRWSGGGGAAEPPQANVGVAQSSGLVAPLPRWQPAAARLPSQNQYVLNDFLRFDDADFVDVAYRKLLLRPPEPGGMQHYLDHLRSGALSKVEILGLIRFSDEGRRHSVHVDGLLVPYKLHQWRHRRIVGWFVGMSMAIVRLPRLAWRLQRMEATAARETQELGRLLGSIEALLEERAAVGRKDLSAVRADLTRSTMARVDGLRNLATRLHATEAAAKQLQSAVQSGAADRLADREVVQRRLDAQQMTSQQLRDLLQAQATERLAADAALRGRLQDQEEALDAVRSAVRAGAAEIVAEREAVRQRLDAQESASVKMRKAMALRDAALDSEHAALQRRIEAREAASAQLQDAIQANDAKWAGEHTAVQRRLDELDAAAAQLRSTVRENSDQQTAERETVQHRLVAQEALAGRLDESIRLQVQKYEQSLEALSAKDADQDTTIGRIAEQAVHDQRSVRAMMDRLTVFLDLTLRRGVDGQEVVAAVGGDAEVPRKIEPGHDYAAFEAVFRGPRDEIKARASHYLGTLSTAGVAKSAGDLVLDLGSGRGEWLEVLAENGYRGRGVDTDKSMLQASRERGDDVVEAAALDYLRTLDDDSVAAITSMHMVEHIPHSVLLQLLDEALRVLRPNGVLILETPNPENVLVGSCTFYMDPSHLHPIPPSLLQWVVQSRGFDRSTVERLTEHRGVPDLHEVPADVAGAAQINQMVAWFTAAPDYAVIARKPDAQ